MKLIVAGGRDFNDFHVVKMTMARLNLEISEIVCGMAQGADMMGKMWAMGRGIPIKPFPAHWGTHGKAAGHIRNREMAAYADALVAFWDGRSVGTHSMIQEARKRGLKVWVFEYNGRPLNIK